MNKIPATALAVMLWVMIPVAAYAACNANIIATKPDSIYTDHGDSTVTDNVTGLMWKQCPEGLSTVTTPCDSGFVETYTWQMALQHVEALNMGGGFASYTDWRLSNYRELTSLVELQCYAPAINTNLFPNTISSIAPGLVQWYWTSSPYLGRMFGSNNSLAIVFYSGESFATARSGTHLVRLVRGGH